MKKLFPAFLLCATMLVFPACSLIGTPSTPETSKTTQEQQSEMRQGEVQRVLMSAARKGTHTLTQTDGKEIFLKSKTENLNSYVDEIVEVRGIITIDSEGDEIMEVTAIKRAGEEDTQEESDTWVTEEFSGVGIALEYPEVLQAFANSTAVSFSYASTTTPIERVHISFVHDGVLATGTSLRTYVQAKAAKDVEHVFEAVRLGAYDGLRKKTDASNALEFYVVHNTDVYRIDFTEEQSTRNWKKYFYQMLDTLQFVERTRDIEETTAREEESRLQEPATTTSPTSSVNPSVSTTNPRVEEERPVPIPSTPTTTTQAPQDPIVTPAPTPVVGTSTQQQVAAYLTGNVQTLQLGEQVRLRGFSFVEPNYVYVTYTDGDARKRVLYQYETSGTTVKTTTVGSFVAGTERDWDRVEGENPVASKEQKVYTVEEGGVKETATVKQGFRLMESASQGYGIQIPANWYYRNLGNGTMGFASTPVEEGNVQTSLQVLSGGLSMAAGTTTSIGNKSAKVQRHTGEDGVEQITIAVEGENGKVYSVTGSAADEQVYRAMLETLQTK